MKQDDCTSLGCSSFGSDHCTECSHARFFGEGTDETGKRWRWEFNPWFGPLFLRKDGEPFVNQPGEDSKAWDVVDKWMQK